MKTDTKKWYCSKTIIAAIVAGVIAITSALYGETSPFVAAIIAIASATGVYGRVVAGTTISG